MKRQVYEVVSPVGGPVVEAIPFLADRLDTFEGKTVCEISNGGFGGGGKLPHN